MVIEDRPYREVPTDALRDTLARRYEMREETREELRELEDGDPVEAEIREEIDAQTEEIKLMESELAHRLRDAVMRGDRRPL